MDLLRDEAVSRLLVLIASLQTPGLPPGVWARSHFIRKPRTASSRVLARRARMQRVYELRHTYASLK
jgi:hypothetical protein